MTSEFEAGAKATEEVAKAAGKAIEATTGLGRFLARTFGPAIEEYGGQLQDSARFRRAANMLELQKRYEKLRIEHETVGEPRALPFKFGHALLDAASLEEEDELQDLFAKLLFNTTDAASHAETRLAFISMLREMNGFDVRVLIAIARSPDANPKLYPTRTVYTAGLPETFLTEADTKGELRDPPQSVMVALNNLARLGCIEPSGVWDGAVSYGLVTFTPLGQALVAACTVGANETAGDASPASEGAEDDGHVDGHVG